jgi:putative oxidoreductase
VRGRNNLAHQNSKIMNISITILKRVMLMITAVLTILFFYTAVTKLLDMEEFRRQLANQTLPGWTVAPLLWLIPLSELLVSILLVFNSTRRIGFYGAAILMLLFTGYVGLVLLNVFGRVPCSCSNLIRNMGFKAHFFFNLFFLTLSIVGIYTSNQQRKGGSVAASDL